MATLPVSDKPPARVLVTTPSTSMAGGVAHYWQALRPYLGSNIRYLTVGARSGRERPYSAAARLLRDYWTFTRALWTGAYDVAHVNPSFLPKALLRDGLLLIIGKALHKRVIVFLHGWDEDCVRTLSARWAWLFQGVYGKADAFIVLGKDFKKRLHMLGCHKQVYLQAAPVERQLLLRNGVHQATTSGTVCGSAFNILFLARVEKQKGIHEALEAYRILKQQHPLVSLTVAGRGSELDAARKYVSAQNLDGVSFIGHVEGEAKEKAFRAAQVYLLPSHTEGLPLSVLEAMACGLPVVACAVGGLPDFFRNGKMGFITESRDPEILAALLKRLLVQTRLRARIGLFNHCYARNKFSPPRVAARLERVYEAVLENAR